jgi:hypothetical protein
LAAKQHGVKPLGSIAIETLVGKFDEGEWRLRIIRDARSPSLLASASGFASKIQMS